MKRPAAAPISLWSPWRAVVCWAGSLRRCCGALKIRELLPSVHAARNSSRRGNRDAHDSLHAPSIISQSSRWRRSRRRCGSSARVCDACDSFPPPMARSNACFRPRPPPVKKCRRNRRPPQRLCRRRPSPPDQMLPPRPHRRFQTICRNGEH